METMQQITDTLLNQLSIVFIKEEEGHYHGIDLMGDYALKIELTLDNRDEIVEIGAELYCGPVKFEFDTFASATSTSVLKEVDAIVENAKNLVGAIETFTNKKGVYSY